MDIPASSPDSKVLAKADRIGIGASILCANTVLRPFYYFYYLFL